MAHARGSGRRLDAVAAYTRTTRRLSIASVIVAALSYAVWAQTPPGYPILFVTQVPVPEDFATIGSVFGNRLSDVESAPRRGDLWIRYPDGTLKNLTEAAGFGQPGLQGARAIAVREPSVHWSGSKALFSMVVGSNLRQYEYGTFFWQMYETTGLGPAERPAITRVANQPDAYNNVSPVYGTDDRIIFTSDRRRGGEAHLYPQLDEYEATPTVTGLWSLDPASGDLFLLQHAPSGSFSPLVDSFGRIVFTRWNHLERDQLADADANGHTYGTFNYSDESATALRLSDRTEVFPEPRPGEGALLGTNLEGISFNHFSLWQIEQDGTGEETLNHLGRHETRPYFNRSFRGDPNLEEFDADETRPDRGPVDNFLQPQESPLLPGTFVGTDAPEFETHAAGQLVEVSAPPSANPDDITIRYLTHRVTHQPTASPDANHSGLYRDFVRLLDGGLVAAHTLETRADDNTGTHVAPRSRFAVRLTRLRQTGNVWAADTPLTPGITEAVSYWDPDVFVSYSGPLWELNPVEVRPRPWPVRRSTPLEGPERRVFAQAGVSVGELQTYLKTEGLALIVSRNVTTRDRAERQQPFNLRVPDTNTRSVGAGGTIYDVSHLQLMQADQIRGFGGIATPDPGRRILAQPLHAPAVRNPPGGRAPGSVAIALDGSIAVFVPARRALSWQLLDPAGRPVVRERHWLTFQPGEIRVCGSCHGVNSLDQAGLPALANEPEALRQLLEFWKRAGAGTR